MIFILRPLYYMVLIARIDILTRRGLQMVSVMYKA